MIGQRGLGRRVRRDGEEDSCPAQNILSLLDEDEVRERGLDLDGLHKVCWHKEDTVGTLNEKEDSTKVPETVYYYYQPVASVKRSRPSLSPAVAKLTARLNEAKDRLRRLRLLEGQSHEKQDLGELIDKWRGVVEAVLEELTTRAGASRRAILRSVGADRSTTALEWLTINEDDEPDQVDESDAESERRNEQCDEAEE